MDSTKNAILLINSNWEKIVKKFGKSRRDVIGLVLHRLRENLARMEFRYNGYSDIEKRIILVGSQKSKKSKEESLSFLQLKLVDKVEAFHQQVYSTLSVLILFLTHFRIEDLKDFPINSVKRFLEHVKKRIKCRSTLYEQIDLLERSIDFRSKFIDHPQQHAIHDWMTYGYLGKYYVIYFIRHGREVYYREPKEPFEPDFQPPVNCKKDFYVSPDKDKTYKALHYLVVHLLGLN